MATLPIPSAFFLIIFSIACLNTAIAKPVPPPDLLQCQPALEPDNKTLIPCCLPVGTNKILDFRPPPYPTVRVRPAAHLVDESYVAKYTKAVGAMKALGPDHPWNHLQQANIHCAYCNGAYNMSGYPVNLQIHSSWLFFPFHRLYLYFYERILGKLIGDDTFAIPFWNWDAPDGMTIPAMYVNSSCTLYDPLRDHAHQPPAIVDFNYLNKTDAPGTVNLTDRNMRTLYRQMVSAKTAKLFLGSKYVAGMLPSPGMGSVENLPHNTVHLWTGDRNKKFLENMGTFYASARDPIFYAHHSNIDRMWHLWKTLPGKNRQGFQDDEWLNASFVFWDENLQLVRARVRDALDTLKLGYTFQDVPVPWLEYKPLQPAKVVEKPEPGKRVQFPVRLGRAVTVEVKRPKVSRSEGEKEDEEEVLVVDEVKLERGQAVAFDVYVNAGHGDGSVGPESVHFAGSFVHVPTRIGRKNLEMTTKVLLGITELLSEIDADGDDRIVVSLVPRRGGEMVTVGDVRIEFSS